MAEARLRFNNDAWRQIRTSQAVDAAVLDMAVAARDAANRWAAAHPRSGKHPGDVGPHFTVVEEPGRNRARYTVRPATAFGTWLVQHDPAGFMACLEAARR